MTARAFVVAALVAACSRPVQPAATPSAPAPAAAPAPGPRVDRDNLASQLTAYVESYGRNWGEARKFSGFALVAQGDEVVYQRGFGYADVDAKRPNTADTSFRIGSVTKQFTAAAILVLAQRGKLSVTDPISAHIPDYPRPGAKITIHQLLTHTAGIPSYTNFPEFMAERSQPRTVAELLALFWDKPLEFEPGSRFAYSNSGYIVLGAIIERASGMSYAEFLARALFAPAGLTRTAVGDDPDAPHRALAYQVKDGKRVPAEPIDMSVPYAAGAVRSTAGDLVRWHQALAGDVVLTDASRRAMYQPDKDDYAYGWLVHEVEGHPVIEHGGGIDGFSTAYVRIPDADVVIVVWSNVEQGVVREIARAAVRAAFGAKLEPVDEPAPAAVDPEQLARVAGRYRITDASRVKLAEERLPAHIREAIVEVTIRASEGGVSFAPAGMPTIELVPGEGGGFFNIENHLSVAFPRDESSGAVTGMLVTQGPLRVEYSRVE